jgi:hypothetical protein
MNQSVIVGVTGCYSAVTDAVTTATALTPRVTGAPGLKFQIFLARLKRLKKVRSKRGKGVYYYVWVGGPRIATDAAPGTPEFMRAYNEAIAKAKPPDTR